MTGGAVRAAAKAILRRLRCEVRTRREPGVLHIRVRHPRIPAPTSARPPVPRLFDDPLEALYHLYGGKPAAFACPIHQCVDINGLSFRPDGWHPYTATLLEHIRGEVAGYEGSALQRYYERWQPRNMLEALVDLPSRHASRLRELPSHLAYFYPWSAKSIAEADAAIKNNHYHDRVEHGRPDLTVEEHGCGAHGPLTDEAARLDFERLLQVYHSIAAHGYRRECGDLRVLVVRRDGRYRFLVSGNGRHRAAAMRALGYRTAPATFNNVPNIFDVADAHLWPQVRSGPWSERAARAYVDHLFDFDAAGWARRNGIAADPGHSRVAPRQAAAGGIGAA